MTADRDQGAQSEDEANVVGEEYQDREPLVEVEQDGSGRSEGNGIHAEAIGSRSESVSADGEGLIQEEAAGQLHGQQQYFGSANEHVW